MSFIAGGMESDLSDSDDAMCFSYKEPSSSGINDAKKHKNPNLDFVAVSKEAVAANGNFKPILETLPDIPRQSQNQTPNVTNSSKRYSVTHKGQPLDDLRYAILQGNLDVVKSLLDLGIKVDCILKSGWTGLMYACTSAHDHIVQYFLEEGADPNYHKDFFTPLMAVCASTKPEPSLLKCCRYLLQHKAEVNVHERHLTTPLMFAAKEGHFCIVQELMEAGADMGKQDNRGRTALMWAAACGYGQIVRFLLIKGADPNAVDSFGQTATDLATHEDYKEVAALLEKSASLKIDNLEITTDEITDAEIKDKKHQAKLFPPNSTRLQNNSRFHSRKDELEIFLRGLDLGDLIDTIKEHKLTFYQFLNLNEKELESLGVSQIGARKSILDAAQGVHKEKWKRSSLPNMKQLPYISCPDAVGMIANIGEHLEHIASQIIYIRLQIQAEPKILELAQDTANVHTLVEETDNGLKKVKTLYDELRFLKLYLHKVEGNTQYVPADLIEEDELKPDKAVWKTKFVFGVFIVSVTIGGILWKKPESLTHINSFLTSKIPYLK